MEYRCHSQYSRILDRELPFVVFGHTGKPVMVFPTQNGRCTDFHEFHMPETVAEHIEAGRVQLFCVDSIDRETWSDKEGDKGRRAWLQELWFRYCTEEFTPLMLQMNGTRQAPLTMGCSMGATHALNTFLRRPDLFDGVIALSGAYDARYFFGDYMDSNLYNNSIVDYMAGLALDHTYIPMFNARAIYICTGQGAWEEEMIRTTTMVRNIFEEKGIHAFIDFWGHDVDHDWPWWRRQFPYFLNKIL
ncbi:alpha/beta hydrolase-fold protein [uncultured Mailhella sp.]|uniref:esterase family protein n=1 Tax=uncultured Mailhella sp. TaxID=1981031 RepID=UPI0025FF9119|nr:alpha/beta hydrolase-fold protein [uncultured Mailhella sp.]